MTYTIAITGHKKWRGATERHIIETATGETTAEEWVANIWRESPDVLEAYFFGTEPCDMIRVEVLDEGLSCLSECRVEEPDFPDGFFFVVQDLWHNQYEERIAAESIDEAIAKGKAIWDSFDDFDKAMIVESYVIAAPIVPSGTVWFNPFNLIYAFKE